MGPARDAEHHQAHRTATRATCGRTARPKAPLSDAARRELSPGPAPPTDDPLPDIVAPGLRAIFVGINPGMASARAGAHFANPRNDFWRLLHDALLTPRLLAPAEQRELLGYGLGVTNAARRATPGSGDLRAADFAGAAERLAKLSADLRPGYLAFVGKEAYRGAFGRTAQLGLLADRLAETRLFVLPSTSPANAAVPYEERLRWFQELAGRLTGRPLRPGVRALVVDPADRVLLVRFAFPGWGADRTWWAPPGGGLEPDESDLEALERELLEEVGLDKAVIGPCVWTREHWFAGMARWGGQRERIYLVRTPEFEPAGTLGSDALSQEGVVEIRWWTLPELAASRAVFAPRRLPTLLPELLRGALPDQPIDVGV